MANVTLFADAQKYQELMRWLKETSVSSNYDEIEQALRRNAHILDQIRRDLRREIKNGVRTVLAVDFSEVFAYLHPEVEQGNETRVMMAETVFEASPLRMTLPPAAMQEFVEHMNFISRKATSPGTSLDELSFFQRSDLAQAARRAISHATEDKQALRDLVRQVSEQWPSLLRLAREALHPRLDSLFVRMGTVFKRIEPLDEFISYDSLDIDPIAFGVSFELLKVRRAMKPQQNYRDAVNFALTAHVNLQSFGSTWPRGKMRPYLLLLSRGTVAENLEFDPIPDNNGEHNPGLVRTIEYAALRTVLERNIPDPMLLREVVGHKQEELRLKADFLDRAAQRVRSGQSLDSLTSTQPASFLAHFGKQELPPEFALGSDLVEVFAQEPAGSGGVPDPTTSYLLLERLLSAPASHVRQIVSDRQRAVSNWKQRLEDELEKAKRASKNAFPVQMYDHVQALKVEGEARNGTGSFTIKVPSTGVTIARIRRTPHAFSVFCECSAGRLPWFCRLAKHLIGIAAEKETNTPVRQASKFFEGVDLLSPRGDSDSLRWHAGPLGEDLALLDDPDGLWRGAMSQFGSVPKTIRVSTPYMDLAYNFIPDDFMRSKGQACLITHLGMVDVVAAFVARCSAVPILEETLQATFRDIIGSAYPIYPTTE